MKLKATALRSKLKLTRLAIRLKVVVGDFIAALVPTDSAFISDLLSNLVGKNKQDSVAVSDVVAHTPNKRTSEVVSITDGGGAPYFAEDYVTGAPSAQTYTLVGGFYWAIYKTVLEAPKLTDLSSKVFTKVLAETVTVAEHISGVSPLDESVNESPAVTDSRVTTFNKRRTETAGTTDSKVLQFGKRVSETPRVVDAKVSSLYRAVGDAAGVTDGVVYRSVSKVVSEAPTVSSSGSLYSQGYTVDMSYFAEDYVGSSRAFS